MKLCHSRLLILTMILLFLVGCGPNEAIISQTVVSQVAAAVSETVVAQPTATLYPTQTPYDTATPYATYTPLATAVPPNTATSYPTYTPYPTYTVEPTATATVAPTNTPAPQVTAPSSQPAATQPPSVDQHTQLLTTLENVLRDIETMQGVLRPLAPRYSSIDQNTTILPTDCPALIVAYDRVSNVLILDTTASSPTVQNAYSTYRAGVEAVLSILSPRVGDCRTLMASGSTGNIMGNAEFGTVITNLREPISWLNQAANDLRQE